MKGTLRFLVTVALFALLLSACGRAKKSTKETTPMTPTENIMALENSGAIPKLDRSSTIAGTDANNNSIRDDIDIYIDDNYSTAPQRAAASQTAKAIQNALLVDTTNIEAVKVVDRAVTHGIHCIYLKFDGSSGTKQPSQVVNELESITANTKSRLLAYLKYNKALNGTSSALPEGDTCDE